LTLRLEGARGGGESRQKAAAWKQPRTQRGRVGGALWTPELCSQGWLRGGISLVSLLIWLLPEPPEGMPCPGSESPVNAGAGVPF
jgi:hypothetical protein